MQADHWPWWLGACALSGVAVVHVLVLGRPLGVSGLVERAVRGPDGRSSNLLFLGGLVLGGLLAAWTGGAGSEAAVGSIHIAALSDATLRGLALFGGSVLVGLGTALAGGCTSGHGLVGCARLQPGSLVATASFFGTAVAVSLAWAHLAGSTAGAQP